MGLVCSGSGEAEHFLDILHACPITEIARRGRTLHQWRHEILADFATGRPSTASSSCPQARRGLTPLRMPPANKTRTMLIWEGGTCC